MKHLCFRKSVLVAMFILLSSLMVRAGQLNAEESSIQGISTEKVFKAEEDSDLAKKLITVIPDSKVKAKWFCSFYNDSEFIARATLVLGEDGTGFLNEQGLDWTTRQTSQVEFQIGDWQLAISNIQFSHRVNYDDQFDGIIGEHSKVHCDWSGATDLKSKIFTPAEIVDSLDGLEVSIPENLEKLVTPRGDSIFWMCDISGDDVSEFQEYRFYLDGRGHSVFDFEWRPTSPDSVQLKYGSELIQLGKIQFLTPDNKEFSAVDSRDYKHICRRG